MRNVAIVVFGGVELLDFAGPGEVFASTRTPAGRAFNVYTVAARPKPILSQGFVTVTPQYTFENCPEPDIVVVPGGGVPLSSLSLRRFLVERAASSEIVMSVCNGATMLAVAGLLEGLEVTTHHGSLRSLQLMEPSATVLSNRRFVDHGRILTSAGVSAGIDGALQIVSRLRGEEVARGTARYMEYDWRPEELARLHAQPGQRIDDALTRRLLEIIAAEDLEVALANYRGDSAVGGELPSEGELNSAGYALLGAGRAPDASRVFELVVALASRSANAHDSLAEACERMGERERAVEHSKRALDLLEADGSLSDRLRSRIREACEARIARISSGEGSGDFACPPCGQACDSQRFTGEGFCTNDHCGMELIRVVDGAAAGG